MKLLILALVVVLNTGCASYCLSSVDSSYNDEMKEFQEVGKGKTVTGLKFSNFIFKDKQRTLYSFDGCLRGRGRLLYIFIPQDDPEHFVEVFEDDELQFTGGEEVSGSLNIVPPFIEDDVQKYEPDAPIQINLSQLFICHGGGHTSTTIIEKGKVYHGGLVLHMKERNALVSGLIKSGYLITVPVDIVITPPLLVVACTIALFKSF